MSALPHYSDIDLLGYGKRVIDLDSEIADCTLDLSVAQQELSGARGHSARRLQNRPLGWSLVEHNPWPPENGADRAGSVRAP